MELQELDDLMPSPIGAEGVGWLVECYWAQDEEFFQGIVLDYKAEGDEDLYLVSYETLGEQRWEPAEGLVWLGAEGADTDLSAYEPPEEAVAGSNAATEPDAVSSPPPTGQVDDTNGGAEDPDDTSVEVPQTEEQRLQARMAATQAAIAASSAQTSRSSYGFSSDVDDQPSDESPAVTPTAPSPSAAAPKKAVTPTQPTAAPKKAAAEPPKAAREPVSAGKKKPAPVAAPAPSDAELCSVCGKELSGGVVQAAGGKYHSECFVCSKCTSPISGQFFRTDDSFLCGPCVKSEYKCAACGGDISKQFVEVDGKRLHVECHKPAGQARTGDASVCKRCKGAVGDEPHVDTGTGSSFHQKCFFCDTCEETLSGAFFPGEAPRLLCCVTCHEAALPHCAGCGQKLNGPRIGALDQFWHEKCFVCTTCEQPFGGSFVVRDDMPYCSGCAGQ